MAYLLSTQTLYTFAMGTKAGVHEFAKTQPKIEICASVVSFGQILHAIESESNFIPSKKEKARRLLHTVIARMAAIGTFLNVDPLTMEKWAEITGYTLTKSDGSAIGEDSKLILATALARDLVIVGNIEPAHKSLIGHGMRVFDPNTNAQCP